jgi:hypothetical protein
MLGYIKAGIRPGGEMVEPNDERAIGPGSTRGPVDRFIEVATGRPVLALSARWHTYPERLAWIAEHGFALEYGLDPKSFALLPERIAPMLEASIPVRYHGFFPGHEFAHADRETALRGLDVHLSALEAMYGWGEPVITVHIGLHRQDPLDPGRAMDHLGRLVERGRQLGITVCLENLRRGPTSHPETVAAWAAAAGSQITLDVGHAVSSQHVLDGELTVIEFVETFEPRLAEVHLYEREADRHYPPQDMRTLGPIVDRLLETGCAWWTLELDDPGEALATRTLVLQYLASK